MGRTGAQSDNSADCLTELVGRVLRQALTVPGLSRERDISAEFDRLLAMLPGASWQDAGSGLALLDAAERIRLLRLTFAPVFPGVTVAPGSAGRQQCARELERLTGLAQAAARHLRELIPEESATALRFGPVTTTPTSEGTQYMCVVQGVIHLSVPTDVLSCLQRQGEAVVSGRSLGRGNSHVAAAYYSGKRLEDYEFWDLEVRLTASTRPGTTRVFVDRPLRQGLPLEVSRV